MILKILRHLLSPVKTLLDLCVSDVATYDDGTVKAQSGRYRVFCKFSENILHRLIKIDLYSLAFACLTEFLRDQTCRIVIEFLDPDTVLIDLCLDITVCRTAYTESYRSRIP